MELAEINQSLETLPSIKARLAEELKVLEVEEKKVRALAYLREKNSRQKEKPTVNELEALVDSSPEVIAKSVELAKKEAEFMRAKDELDSVHELACNERAVMRNIDPSV